MAIVRTIRPYRQPAGGWGALRAMETALAKQGIPISGLGTLAHMNQPDGFDCPGCAWPDPRHTSSFEYCENGAKAVAWEATDKRCTPEFFAAHTVATLEGWNDYDLEMAGRLSHPMRYEPATDRYVPVSWDDAFSIIARHLNALPDPNMAEFYTSGRTSNEAAFLYQLFVREYGTNNFPDCSNMCHEATSVGLPQSLGVGKGTVLLDDFDRTDCIFIFGQNPGTNSPRMMTSLRNASRRGATIMSFNPFRERALERFQAPQNPVEMATLGSTPISSRIFQVKVGGDVALLKGIMKWLVAADRKARSGERPLVLDWDFINGHTVGIDALIADLDAATWEDIERRSGLGRDDIEVAARAYAGAERAIIVFGMGITQHRHGARNVQQLANLTLLRGNIGRDGAGLCPVRGHSNVQGDRTVGITENPSTDFLDRLKDRFGFEPPRRPGHNVVTALEAMTRGEVRAFIGLGGNITAAIPDWQATRDAFRGLDLTVQISTKLNRSHLVHGREALILPCLGRTEIDMQATGPQAVTVEDSMSMVHASRGMNAPASEHLRSEPAIVAGMARATLGARSRVDWERLVGDYALIREDIEAVFPIFEGYNARIQVPGGFHLTSLARERIWATPSGKANFLVTEGLCEDPAVSDPDALWLTTMRSHDQYNTTLYSLSDRYRGVYGQRDVLFLNEREMERRGLKADDRVDIATIATDGVERVIRGFRVVPYDFPDASCAAYYPEANPLVPLYAHDPQSHTPSYKGIPVRLAKSNLRPATRSGEPAMLTTVQQVCRTTWRGAFLDEDGRAVPEEAPVALTYNGTSHAVMMATPADLEDFACGFGLTEGIVDSPGEIDSIEIVELDNGIEARAWIDTARMSRLLARRRHMAGPTGCGLCGIESLAEAIAPPRLVGRGSAFMPAEIMEAVDRVTSAQTLHASTRAVHGAGCWTPRDGVVAVREDLGRHNALDKLVGAIARSGRRMDDAIVVLTSRVSLELVQKAAVAGAPLLVAISAPTALAIRMADAAGMTLVGVARNDGFEVFTHRERIIS